MSGFRDQEERSGSRRSDESSDPMQYIYYLIDPRNNLPFYVGRSTDPTMRLMQHIKSAQKQTNRRSNLARDALIKAILDVGLSPNLEIVKSVTDAYVARREEFIYIQHLRHWIPDLVTNKQTQIN